MKNNMMKKLLTLVLAGAMTLSLAACGAKDTPSADQPDNSTEEAKTYKVAVIKQLDHASLDEIANAVAAELDQLAQTEGVKIEYEITSGQGDQTILKQLADQAIADGVDAIVPIATTAAQIAALSAEDAKTPVVYAAVSDPETAKLTGIDYVTGATGAYKKPSSRAVCVMMSMGSLSFQASALRPSSEGFRVVVSVQSLVVVTSTTVPMLSKQEYSACLPIIAAVSVLTVMMPPSMR